MMLSSVHALVSGNAYVSVNIDSKTQGPLWPASSVALKEVFDRGRVIRGIYGNQLAYIFPQI